MMRLLLCAAAVVAICGQHVAAVADDPAPASKRPCCPPRCPHCKAYCKFELEDAKEKKSCWCIERKAICIPKITFPWQKSCEPKCGRVKWVNRLKEVEYECEHCKCKWTAVEVPCPGCANCTSTSGDVGGSTQVLPAPK